MAVDIYRFAQSPYMTEIYSRREQVQFHNDAAQLKRSLTANRGRVAALWRIDPATANYVYVITVGEKNGIPLPPHKELDEWIINVIDQSI